MVFMHARSAHRSVPVSVTHFPTFDSHRIIKALALMDLQNKLKTFSANRIEHLLSLLTEVVEADINPRQRAHNGYEARHDHDARDADALPIQVQLHERVGAHRLDRDLVEHLDLEVAEDSGCELRSAVARDVVVADVDSCQRAVGTKSGGELLDARHVPAVVGEII